MSPFLYAFPCVGVFFESLLFWRLWKMVSRYPYLFAFVLYSLVRDVILFPISWYRPNWFAEVYWRTEMISLFSRFFVNWEFFRGTFPQRSALHEIAWKALLAVELGVLPGILLLSWGQASSLHHLYRYLSPVFEQYLSLAQALLLLAPAAVARYYRVAMGRNMRGLGLGFGIYLSVCSINFAGLQVLHGFVPYGRLLSPAAFIGMNAIWMWAFWDYRPSTEWTAGHENQVA